MLQKIKISQLTVIKIYSFVWILFLAIMSYQLLYPFKTLNIIEPMEILNSNKTVFPGGLLEFRLDYDKEKHYPSTAKKAFYCENGWGYSYESIPESLPVGVFSGEDSLVSGYTLIPKDAPEAKCHLVLDIEIDLGFMGRKEAKIFRTEDFYIKR